MLGPRLTPEAEPTKSELAIRKELRKLHRRVYRINRRINAESRRPAAVAGVTDQALEDVKERLAELEARPVATPAPPSPATQDLERTVAGLSVRLTELSRKVDERVAAIESATAPASRQPGDAAALGARLAKLEEARTQAAAAIEKIQADREKDRTAVIEYLEDLDNRLAALEKAAGQKTP